MFEEGESTYILSPEEREKWDIVFNRQQRMVKYTEFSMNSYYFVLLVVVIYINYFNQFLVLSEDFYFTFKAIIVFSMFYMSNKKSKVKYELRNIHNVDDFKVTLRNEKYLYYVNFFFVVMVVYFVLKNFVVLVSYF